MRYLARREYSRQELHGKLLAFVQEGDDVGALLDDLERRNWLSDTRAAAQMVKLRQQRFGAQRIVHELRQKGIDQALIDAALPELKENELAAAREVWQKKFGHPPQDAKEKARQARFLQSRGFPMAIVFKLLRMDDESVG
jgi:regulatory protein